MIEDSVLLIPVTNFPTGVNDTGGKFAAGVNDTGGICHRYQRHQRQICHRCQWHRRQIMGTISGCFHLPPVSMATVVHLELRISPANFWKIRNGPNGVLRGLGKADSWKNSSQKSCDTVPLTTAVGAASEREVKEAARLKGRRRQRPPILGSHSHQWKRPKPRYIYI